MDDAIADLAVERDNGAVLAVFRASGGDLHGENVIRREAGRDGLETHVAADEEAGAGEEHEREGELGDDEEAAQAVARQTQAAAGGAAAAGRFEGGIDVHSDRAPGGGDAEEEAGDDGDAEGEGENGAVDLDFLQTGDVAGVDGSYDVESPLGDEETGGAAHDGEEKALGEQLADDAQAAGAQGGTDGDFFFARGGAGEQEVGDVGAGDQ